MLYLFKTQQNPLVPSAAGTYAASVIATDIKNKIDFVINANGSDVAMNGSNIQ